MDNNMLTIHSELLVWVFAIAFLGGWYVGFLTKDRKPADAPDKVFPDPDYIEWYIRSCTYADGRITYTVYHQSEDQDTVPWSHGTLDSFDGAMLVLNEAKRRHEASKIVATRNYIVR